MLKHKQTIWLTLAAICTVGVFFFDLLSITWKGYDFVQGQMQTIQKSETYSLIEYSKPLSIFAGLIFIILFITIRQYQQHRLQYILTAISIMLSMIFVGIVMELVHMQTILNALSKVDVIDHEYKTAFYLPFVSITLLVLAIIGVRKDEKLVKTIR